MAFELKGTRRDFEEFDGVVYMDDTTHPAIILISYFSIMANCRRKGNGTRLVQHLEELATKQNKDLIFLCVAPESETEEGLDSPMCKLLNKLGYRYMDCSIHMCKNPTLSFP